MLTGIPRRKLLLVIPSLALFALVLLPSTAIAATSYTYDQLGRVTTALYGNGLCLAYAYDANGNRTSQTATIGGAPTTPTWGTGTWGCFNWTP